MNNCILSSSISNQTNNLESTCFSDFETLVGVTLIVHFLIKNYTFLLNFNFKHKFLLNGIYICSVCSYLLDHLRLMPHQESIYFNSF